MLLHALPHRRLPYRCALAWVAGQKRRRRSCCVSWRSRALSSPTCAGGRPDVEHTSTPIRDAWPSPRSGGRSRGRCGSTVRWKQRRSARCWKAA